MADDNLLGQQIADARARLQGKAPEPVHVAQLLVHNLFDRGSVKLSSVARKVAENMLQAGLTVWRDQLLAQDLTELAEYKRQYKDNKEELENLKLQVAIWKKEGKV